MAYIKRDIKQFPIELSDGARYVSFVKQIDRQLLDQLKRNEYFIEEEVRDLVQVNSDPATANCWYLAGVNDRINRIMEKGEWRNKLYAEFEDASSKYVEYKTAYCKAVNVAVIERYISENGMLLLLYYCCY